MRELIFQQRLKQIIGTFKGSGCVVRSLEAALWAFYSSASYEDACLRAVNLGDDADTTGAVYGQLAGAYYGYEGIPESWREKVALRGVIEDMAERLLRVRCVAE